MHLDGFHPSFLVLLGLFTSIFTLDWGNVETAQDLSAIDDNKFLNFTENDAILLSKKGVVCTGFQPGQIENISDKAMNGFSSKCVGLFSKPVCQCLTGLQWKSLNYEAFSGITSDCVSQTTGGVLKAISVDQLLQIPAETCGAIPDDVLMQLNPDAYPGFTNSCLSKIKACDMLNEEGFSKIPLTSFKGFTTQCTAKFTVNICKRITSFGAFSYLALGSINVNCLKNAPPIACSTMGPQQMHYLGVDITMYSKECFLKIPPLAFSGLKSFQARSLSIDNDCAVLSPAQFKYIKSDVVKEFTSVCISNMRNDVFSNALPLQITNLSPSGCGVLTFDQLSMMSDDGIYGFTASCLSNLNPKSCAGFSGNVLNKLFQGSIYGLQAKCIENLPSTVFAKVTPSIVSMIDEKSCSGITAADFRTMDSKVYSGFRKACIQNFSHIFCNGIQTLATFSVDDITSFDSFCIANLNSYAFKGLSAAHVAQFSHGQCGYINAPDVFELSTDVYSSFQGACLEAFQIAINCVGFRSFGDFLPEQISHFHPICISGFQPKAYESLTKEHVANIQPEGVNRICPNCVASIPPEAFIGFTPTQAGQFNAITMCKSFTGLQLNQLSDEAFPEITKFCVAAFDPSIVFNTLTANKISVLTPKQCHFLSHDTLKPLNNRSKAKLVNAFNTDCIHELPSASCDFMGPEIVQILEDEKLKQVSSECLSFWPEDSAKVLTISKVKDIMDSLGGFCTFGSSKWKMTILLKVVPETPLMISSIADKMFSEGQCWTALNDDVYYKKLVPNINKYDSRFHSNLAIFMMEDKLAESITLEEFLKIQLIDLTGFREGHATYFSSVLLSSINAEMMNHFSDNFWLGVEKDKVSHLNSTEVFSTLDFQWLPPNAMEFLTDSQLNVLNDRAKAKTLSLCHEQSLEFFDDQLVGRDFLKEVVMKAKNEAETCYRHSSHSGGSSSSMSSSSSSSSSSSTSKSSSSSGSSGSIPCSASSVKCSSSGNGSKHGEDLQYWILNASMVVLIVATIFLSSMAAVMFIKREKHDHLLQQYNRSHGGHSSNSNTSNDNSSNKNNNNNKLNRSNCSNQSKGRTFDDNNMIMSSSSQHHIPLLSNNSFHHHHHLMDSETIHDHGLKKKKKSKTNKTRTKSQTRKNDLSIITSTSDESQHCTLVDADGTLDLVGLKKMLISSSNENRASPRHYNETELKRPKSTPACAFEAHYQQEQNHLKQQIQQQQQQRQITRRSLPSYNNPRNQLNKNNVANERLILHHHIQKQQQQQHSKLVMTTNMDDEKTGYKPPSFIPSHIPERDTVVTNEITTSTADRLLLNLHDRLKSSQQHVTEGAHQLIPKQNQRRRSHGYHRNPPFESNKFRRYSPPPQHN